MRTFASLVLVVSCAIALSADTFPDYGCALHANWTGPRFSLSQDYPKTDPPEDVVSW
jgi:hypothetical protein